MTGIETSMLRLRCGSRAWQIAAAAVLEVVPWPALTPVPLAPGCLRGIFGWERTFVPVVDLLALADGPGSHEPAARSVCVVQLTVANREFPLGIAVDEVVAADAAESIDALDTAAIVAALAAPQAELLF